MAGNSLCICSKNILYFTCKGFLQLLLLVYAIFKILSIQREFLQLARAWVVWGKGKKNRNCRRKNWPSKRGRGGRCGGNSASPQQKIKAAPPPACCLRAEPTKILFSFLKEFWAARANQKSKRVFCLAASGSERRRG